MTSEGAMAMPEYLKEHANLRISRGRRQRAKHEAARRAAVAAGPIAEAAFARREAIVAAELWGSDELSERAVAVNDAYDAGRPDVAEAIVAWVQREVARKIVQAWDDEARAIGDA